MKHMKPTSWVVVSVLSAGLVGAFFMLLYTGAFNVAADDPHWDVTTRALAWTRERSISTRAIEVAVPDLADPELIALGAEHYGAMCVGCHLAPGMGDNELRQGLNPKPPNLTERRDRRPAESFWIIKHGIKMSGMPAWGVTHDDDSIWGLVAFLQQLPTLDAAGYQALTIPGPGDGTMPDGHGHDHARGHDDQPPPVAQETEDSSAAKAPSDESQEPAPQPAHDHVHGDEEGHEH